MKKYLWVILSTVIVLAMLFSCVPKPTENETLTTGYYVAFDFQFKGEAFESATPTISPLLKMTSKGDNKYELSIRADKLKQILEDHDKNGVYWWNVVNVADPNDRSTWIFYGGTGEYDPSVPILKEDLDAFSNTVNIKFYADIPESTNTIVGFGDNTKIGRDLYFVGSPTEWSHQKMTNKEDGTYELEVTIATPTSNMIEYKIWPADTWGIAEPTKALAFNGKNYYATAGNGKYDFGSVYPKKIKATFDARYSTVKFDLIESATPTTGPVDGDLADWGSALTEDATNDSAWGESNELFKAGIKYDDQYLYIAGVYNVEGNNFICLADLSGLNGATDTSKHPWNRSYTFETGDIDLAFESWGNDFNVWKVTSDAFTEVKGVSFAKFSTDDGKIVVEAAIPLSALDVTAESLTVKGAFAITGGVSDGTQWVGDFCPEQACGTGGITAPATIDEFIVYPAG
ncbi:MAG: hypothetical protein WBH60_06370 [Fervidobacterium sp.]